MQRKKRKIRKQAMSPEINSKRGRGIRRSNRINLTMFGRIVCPERQRENRTAGLAENAV